MTAKTRLWLSAILSLIFYGAWGYYANSLVTDDMQMLIRSALVQGIYSSGVTLIFTYVIELSFTRFGVRSYSFSFMSWQCPGTLFSPLIPLAVQAILVVFVNWVNQTPNLIVTVAPSIIFSAIYGYVYTFGLLKQHKART